MSTASVTPTGTFRTKRADTIRPGMVLCVGTSGRYMVTRRRLTLSDEVVLTMSDVNSVLRISEFRCEPEFPLTTVVSDL